MEDKIAQLIQKADASIDLGRIDLAIALANEALEQNPEESLAYVVLARAYYVKREYRKASELIREALKRDPGYSYAHVLYALVLIECKEKKEAQKEFETAVVLDPFNPMSHRFYSWFLINHLKEKEKARFHAEKALELEPDLAENHLMYGRILAEFKEYELAEKAYEEALRLEPENFNTHYGYGVYWLFVRKNPKKAYPFFCEAVRLNPEDEKVRRQYFRALKTQNLLYFLLFSLLLPIGNLGFYGGVGLFFGLKLVGLVLEKLNYVQLAEMFYTLSTIYISTILFFWILDKILHYLIKKGWYVKQRS